MTALQSPPLPGAAVNPADDQATRLRAMVNAAARAPEPAPPRAAAPAPIPRPAVPVVAIASGKGGVGKTSIAVNLSIALAEPGRRITLIDADVGLGNADLICGVTPSGHLAQALAGARSLADIAVNAPGGFRLIPGGSGLAAVADGASVSRTAAARCLRALEASTDALLIDCGAGIGPGVFSFLDVADLVVVVATPEPTAVADAYALVKCLAIRRRQAGPGERFPRAAVLINQARSREEASAVHARIASVAQRFLGWAPPLVGWVPADPAVAGAVRARRPLLLAQPRAPASGAIRILSGSLAQALRLDAPIAASRRGLFARFVRAARPRR